MSHYIVPLIVDIAASLNGARVNNNANRNKKYQWEIAKLEPPALSYCDRNKRSRTVVLLSLNVQDSDNRRNENGIHKPNAWWNSQAKCVA